MKNSAIIFLIFLFAFAAAAQEKKPVKKSALSSAVVTEVGGEKLEFQKAVAKTNPFERIAGLQKFLEEFPESESKTRAAELIVSGRAEIAAEKLRLGDTKGGVELFKIAVKDAPSPISEELFTKVILQFPTNLFLANQPQAALEIADLIEGKIGGNVRQILGLAAFYLGTENSFDAVRLGRKAVELDPNLPAAYQTLGLAYRMNFELEKSAEVYAKALELDKNSVISRRSLAEMKRAMGKPDEASALYKTMLKADAADANAQTGLILSLLDAGEKAEAEAQLTKSLETNPNNLPLLVGAAYWYAGHGQAAKAVELAQNAVNIEPRYTWAHIALARGLMAQNRPLDAERVLLAARRYGDFPTLTYEIAAARIAAGFYREAAEELKKRFVVENGTIKTKLGGRVLNESDNFSDLLSLERRASIFQPQTADNPENAAKLKALLDFSQKLENKNADKLQVSEAVDKFVGTADAMRFHRQLFAANRLLEKKKNLPKALELTKSATAEVDAALNGANSSAAILADELYDGRTKAISRGEYLVVPEVPKKTLLQIARGRLEETAGQILLQENQPGEAVVRLKRAVSVLPENSSWWRSSLWELGAALETEGKPEEALDAYIKSYNRDEPSAARRIIIEIAYRKVRGNLEGLDDLIGTSPLKTNSEFAANNVPTAPNTESNNAAISVPEENAAPFTEKSKNKNSETVVITDMQPAAKTDVPARNEKKIIPENVPLKKIEEKLRAIPKTDVKQEETKLAPAAKANAGFVPISKSSVTTTDTLPKAAPTAETQPKTQPKNPAIENTEKPKSPVKSEPANNSLFESVIISVPQSQKTEKVNAEKQASPIIPQDDTKKPKIEKSTVRSKTRARIINENPADFGINSDVQPCSIYTSEDEVSLINDGGNVGIVVGFEDKSDPRKIRASVNDPKDIQAVIESDFETLNGNAIVRIKSISKKTGVFIITFEADCGKKEVLVKVR